MPVAGRIDMRQFLVIIVLLMLLYWLIVPSPKRSRDKKLESNDVEKTGSLQSNVNGFSSETIMMKGEQSKFINQLQEKLRDYEAKLYNVIAEKEKANEMVNRIVSKQSSEKSLSENEIIKLRNDIAKIKNESKSKDLTINSMNEIDDSVRRISQENDDLRRELKDLKSKSSKPMYPFKGMKLIHLDLKGAPPKFSYLIEMMKLAKQYGGNGFLVEYEDMFPWSDELKILASPNAYTPGDIKTLLKVAKEEGMLVVPLVQTFGHLEFVLKHKVFSHLRADKEISTSICPINTNSVPFIKKLIDQILNLHEDLEWIHLGGDEVWNLQTCEECRKSSLTKSELYMHHMKPLLSYLQVKTSHKVKGLIWDDMMRDWSIDMLSEMSKYVSPMIWAYVDDLSSYPKFPRDMWDRYSIAFPEIWLASSFKGALKPWSNFVPIQQHLNNHLSWLKITSMLQTKGVKVKGIALTGWSRFDHYGPFCELLPAGVPSLALCLSVLEKGKYTLDIHKNVSTVLGFDKPFLLKITFKYYTPENATYVGNDVYYLVGKLEKALSGWKEWTGVRERGWVRHSKVQKNFISYFQVNQTIYGYNTSIKLLKECKLSAPDILKKYFYNDMVKEWIEDKIDYNIDILETKIKNLNEIKSKLTF